MDKCGETVFDGFSNHRCNNKAKVTRDGVRLCGIHDPIQIAKKRAKQDVKWQKKEAISKIESKISTAQRKMDEAEDTILDINRIGINIPNIDDAIKHLSLLYQSIITAHEAELKKLEGE